MKTYPKGRALTITAALALASLVAYTVSTHAQKPSPGHPFGADFRVTSADSPAPHRAYIGQHSGLLIRITRVAFGRITGDEGCSAPTPQYELHLTILYRNPTNHPQRFDVVGLHVIDQHGQTHRPYDWYQNPNRPSSLGPQQSRTVVLPYDGLRQQSAFSVTWHDGSRPYLPGGSTIARYRLTPSGRNVCLCPCNAETRHPAQDRYTQGLCVLANPPPQRSRPLAQPNGARLLRLRPPPKSSPIAAPIPHQPIQQTASPSSTRLL